MSFSRLGCAAATFRFTYSWTSFAFRSALAWEMLSSNTDFVALKLSAASFSMAAKFELAIASRASTLALLLAVICSGVTYIVIAPKVGESGPSVLVSLAGLRSATVHIALHNENSTEKSKAVKKNLCVASSLV